MSNYIYCSREPLENVYRVWDSEGLLEPAEIEYGTKRQGWVAQEMAEKLAAQLATKFGCDWGTNYL